MATIQISVTRQITTTQWRSKSCRQGSTAAADAGAQQGAEDTGSFLIVRPCSAKPRKAEGVVGVGSISVYQYIHKMPHVTSGPPLYTRDRPKSAAQSIGSRSNMNTQSSQSPELELNRSCPW